jgi:hypothetical protein
MSNVYGGPIDGASIPADHNNRQYLMVVFYDECDPDSAQNFVYDRQDNDWRFNEVATAAGRLGLRAAKEAISEDGRGL